MKYILYSLVFYMFYTTPVIATDNCGSGEINSLFTRITMKQNDRSTIEESIEQALKKHNKTTKDITEILTKEEFDRTEPLGNHAESQAMSIFDELSVSSAHVETKILIRFQDESFAALPISYTDTSFGY